VTACCCLPGTEDIRCREHGQVRYRRTSAAPGQMLRWSDIAPALTAPLQRDVFDPEIVARFTVPGEPVSKQRPRHSSRNGLVYTPTQTKAAEQRVGWAYRQAVGPSRPDGAGTFGVFLAFFCTTGHRRDVDNMSKLVLDGLNGLLWIDDSQVSELSSILLRRQPTPRVEIVVYRTFSTGHPATACE
jgi:Holliday junction resolvase RusA-like endonuclease